MKTQLLNLNYSLSDLQNLQWVHSDIGKQGKRFFDFNYRQSFESVFQIPQTNLENRFGAPTCWKVLKYQNGFFKKHVDHQAHSNHIEVDVLLPPKNICSYQGGELIIYQNDQMKVVNAHQKQWTLIYVPLGTLHQVTPVKGTRISFVRVVYSDHEFEYTVPNEIEAYKVHN